MYQCTECDRMYRTMEAAANCHYGIGGVIEIQTAHVYVLLMTVVNNPDDDSPSSEGDDPVVRLDVYPTADAANVAARLLFDEESRDDGYNPPKAEDNSVDGLASFVITSSFNIYRIDVTRQPVVP